jgi:hypothetical protein
MVVVFTLTPRPKAGRRSGRIRRSRSTDESLGWQANQQFFEARLERGVSRNEYVLPDGFDNVDRVTRGRRESSSAMEINFLNAHASEHGYAREGNAWIIGVRDEHRKR